MTRERDSVDDEDRHDGNDKKRTMKQCNSMIGKRMKGRSARG